MKSYIPVYWKVWLGLVGCVCVARLLLSFGAEGADYAFTLFTCYAVPTWLAIMVLNMVEGRRLMSYLEQNHRKKWEELTHIPFVGSGGANGFRTLPFLYSDDNLADPTVQELKLNYRRFVKLALTVFFTLPLLFILIKLPWGS